MAESYLVIGGSGFLGRKIVEALLARGDAVAVFDIVQRHDSDVPTYVGDIAADGDVLSAIQKSGATCVIHTASPLHGAPDALFTRVNVAGTRAVLAAAAAAGVRKLVYTSSASVIFDGRPLANADERHPLPARAMDVYNASKAQAERLVVAANTPGGLQTVALRPAGIYGPGDRQVMPGFAQVYFDGKTHFQIGDNTNLFDWTYVDNVMHAHLLAADAPGVGGEVIHVTNGAPLPFWDFSRMIWARMVAAGIEPVPRKRRIVLPRLVGMAIAVLLEFVALFTRKEPIFTRFRVTYCCVDRYLNIDKARRLLGYKPLVSTEEGVQRMLDWWLADYAASMEGQRHKK